MTNDAPDWEHTLWKVEVTIRPNQLHPMGKVFYWDEFESPTLDWSKAGSPGYTIETSTAHKFAGTGSMALTTVATADRQVITTRKLSLIPSNKIGLELKHMTINSNGKYIDIGLVKNAESIVATSSIRYVIADEKLQYQKSDSTYEDILGATGKAYHGSSIWQIVKLVVDFNTNKYISYSINDQTFDLKDKSMYVQSLPTTSMVYPRIAYTTATAAANALYIDDVVVTEE